MYPEPSRALGVGPDMRKRAFTLIELMVVVAIIAVIAAILVPNFLRARDTARQRGVTSVAATPQPEPAVPEGAANPTILGLDADLRVDNWTTRSGMDVTSRYRLTYAGAVRAQAPGLLRIPFPHKTEEAMNVRVRLRQGNQEWEPDWTVTRWGLSIPLQGDQVVEATIRFATLGRDQLQLDLPPSPRLGRVHLGLIAEEKGTELSELSLQPQQMPAPGHYTWDMQNLVSESPILLEMPGSHSLTGRVMLLCRLAGLAVLLFGLGFWYVGELYRPGCLSRFNWGHFLMLSLTYSSFFPALGVLTVSMGLPLFQALAIAAGLAQPLLIFHLWRTVNLRFALLYVLPLADLTLALVVNGVFGGQWREAFFLGAGFVAMAFVTLTYGRWRAHRQAWLDDQLQSLQDRIRSLVAQTEELPAYAKDKRIAEQAASLANYAERVNSGVYHFVTSQADSLEASLRAAGRTRPPANSPTPHCTGCGQPGCTQHFCAGCGHARIPIHTCACGTRLCVTARPEKDFFCPTCGQRSHLANSSK
jgi:prepilin-type N-terminal cleavage/methylation domain-containing protein